MIRMISLFQLRTQIRFTLFLIVLSICFCGCDGQKRVNTNGTVTKSENGVKVTNTAAKSIVLEQYKTDDFSMKIPKGWLVATGASNMFHAIRVYDPGNTVNQIFILLKAQPLLHSDSGKKYYEQAFRVYGEPYRIMAQAPVLNFPSTEGFFQIFSQYASFAQRVEPEYANFIFPQFDSFTVLEKFTSNSSMKPVALNPAMLRATFYQNDKKGEGMFTADVVDFSRGANRGMGIDAGYYMVYNIMAITAEYNDFVNWRNILSESLGSLEYSPEFVQKAIAAGRKIVLQSQQLSAQAKTTADGIMSSWEKRNISQDINNQKQSDATLGYERVYDTETGEIYRAANGWSDSYNGKRYKSAKDEMYAQPVDGYIE